MRFEYTEETGVPQRLGKALQRVRLERHMEPTEMTRECEKWLWGYFPPGPNSPSIDNKRILRIIAAGKEPPPEHYAKSVSPLEIEMFEAVFDIPRQCVLEGHQDGSVFIASPVSDPTSARRFKWILAEATHGSKNLIGWAPFLPCSLEPKEFIRAHHSAVFSNMRPEKARIYASVFNDIGEHQRRRFVDSLGKRPWHFWHLMLRADIDRIANGVDEYQHIPLETRMECLIDLANKLRVEKNNLHLVLATGDEPGVRESHAFLKNYDNVAAVDNSFVFWRDGGRNIYASWKQERVNECREELERFKATATFQEAEEVASLLVDLARRAK
jgi:hypothetical protein